MYYLQVPPPGNAARKHNGSNDAGLATGGVSIAVYDAYKETGYSRSRSTPLRGDTASAEGWRRKEIRTCLSRTSIVWGQVAVFGMDLYRMTANACIDNYDDVSGVLPPGATWRLAPPRAFE